MRFHEHGHEHDHDHDHEEGVSHAEIFEGADAPASLSTSYSMEAGDVFYGTQTSGDVDYIALSVTAGETYEISLGGASIDPIDDADLTIYNSSGGFIAQDDISGPGLDALLVYTATYTGVVYLAADTYFSSDTGGYELHVESGTNNAEIAVGSVEDMAAYLTDGSWEATGESRHIFNTTSSNQITFNINGLTSAGQDLALWALEAWEMVADLDFVQTSGSAQITFQDHASGAYSSYTASGGNTISSTVNISTSWLNSYGTGIDSYSFGTYIHEIGHSLGLGHMGEYNGSADFETEAVFLNDSWQMSVMSYFSNTENPNVNATDGDIITAMMADIYAVQDLYGVANGGVTAGDTTFGGTGTLGNYIDHVSAAIANTNFTGDYGGGDILMTLFDEGGNDTLDLSFVAGDHRIDLNDGTFSDLGFGIGNLGIAVGTIIENAILGSGDDTVIGNEADNDIILGGGNDTYIGADGDDTIDGGSGTDEIEFEIAFSNVSSGSVTGTSALLSGGFGTVNTTDVETFVFTDQTLTLAELNGAFDTPGITVTGSNQNDADLQGTGDSDTMYGRGGSDTLTAGEGNDSVYGGIGWDSIDAGDGNDWITGQNGFDSIYGGEGSDTMFGGSGHDDLNGGAGNDSLHGGKGLDTLSGDGGNDTLDGSAGADTLFGGDGDDNLLGNAGVDTVYGDDGDDYINGGINNDFLYGGADDDEIIGNNGTDFVDGGAGEDSLFGGAGADTVMGGADDDYVHGGINNDELYGGAGRDLMYGNNGSDFVSGGTGNDTVYGGAGTDTVAGGGGDDLLHGGTAADEFQFNSGSDEILDFTNNSDTIVFDIALLNDPQATAADLEQYHFSSGDNSIFDFGSGNVLQVNGVSSWTTLMDDVAVMDL